MIDLHCHVLPGVDDGPETWEEALALGARLADEGVTLAVATPHFFWARSPNPDPMVIRAHLARLNQALQGRLRLLLLTVGVRPVLAHPERNSAIRRRPERLRHFVEQGCYVQVDAPSLLGDHGQEARRAALRWIEAELVHVVASDAHGLRARPPKLRRAWEDVVRAYGEAVARALFIENPKAIVEGRDLA